MENMDFSKGETMGEAIKSWDQVERNRKCTDRIIESNTFLSKSFASLI